MRLTLFAKLATLSAAALFASACQKSILGDGTSNDHQTTTPRSATYSEYNVLGHGYNATGRYANEKSAKGLVIDPRKVKANGRLSDTEPTGTDSWEEYGENAMSYSQRISRRVNANAGFKLFGAEISTSFNSLDSSSNYFDAKYIYSTYYFTVTNRNLHMTANTADLINFLDDKFKADIITYSPADLVMVYGTHVMTHIYTGGRLNISYQAETRHSNRTAAARAGAKVTAKNGWDFTVGTSSDVDETAASHNYNRTLSYSTVGGDTRYELVGEINLEVTNRVFSKTAWQNSITKENSKLIEFGADGLTPIYDFISDPVKKQQVKAYVEQYIRSREIQNVYHTVPVYSFYDQGYPFIPPSGKNYRKANHLLTINPGAELLNNYTHEGAKFHAFNYQVPGTVPIHRYYFEKDNDHYYLHNPEDADLRGARYEGVAFYAYKTPSSTNGTPTSPIHRYLNSDQFDHYYVITTGNYSGYHYEGIAFHLHRNAL